MPQKANKTPAAKPAGFDKGPKDFFRGSRGGVSKFSGPAQFRPGKSFIGMRRGSR